LRNDGNRGTVSPVSVKGVCSKLTATVDMNDLCNRYNGRLFQGAYTITKDYHLAQDVVQETLWKAYQKIETLKETDKIGAWLSSIATRTAIDVMRKRQRETMLVPIEEDKNEHLSTNQSVEHEVVLSLLEEEIQDAINELPTDSKNIFLLKTKDGLREKEIAQLLQITESTVKNKVYRARQQIKSLIVV
jgi:RNA polymerase sigma factor (sigma-70 family)